MDGSELLTEVVRAMDGLALLLVFGSVLFGLRYPVAVELVKGPMANPDKPLENRKRRQALGRFIVTQWLPLTLINGMSFGLFFPLAIRVIRNSHFHLWDFDVVLTTYVWITILLASTFLWNAVIGVRLAHNWLRLK